MVFDTFHPFPRLPIELRRKIYGHMMTQPRVVELEWSIALKKWVAPVESYRDPASFVLLRVNKEFHAEFLQHYKPIARVFDCDSNRILPFMKDDRDFGAYFNSNIDTLYAGPARLQGPKKKVRLMKAYPVSAFFDLVKEFEIRSVAFHEFEQSSPEGGAVKFSFWSEDNFSKMVSVKRIFLLDDICDFHLFYKRYFVGQITLKDPYAMIADWKFDAGGWEDVIEPSKHKLMWKYVWRGGRPFLG